MTDQPTTSDQPRPTFEAFVRRIAAVSRMPNHHMVYDALKRATHRDAHKLKVLMYAGREEESVPDTASYLRVEDFEATVGVICGKTDALAEYLSLGLRRAKKEGVDLEGEFGVPETWRARYETKA
jgi:hypothetical protein